MVFPNVKISTTQNYIKALPPKEPSTPATTATGLPLGTTTLGDRAYQFGIAQRQSALIHQSGGQSFEAASQLLKVVSQRLAEHLPHPRLATGIVNSIWFSFDLAEKVNAARSPGVTRLNKALVAAGLTAEAASVIGNLFSVPGVDSAATIVSFVAEHGGASSSGTVEISAADAGEFAAALAGVDDLADVRQALMALAGGK